MTAMVTRVKTNGDMISVNHLVSVNETGAKRVEANKLSTILEQAKQHGLSVGVVSTARITHGKRKDGRDLFRRYGKRSVCEKITGWGRASIS